MKTTERTVGQTEAKLNSQASTGWIVGAILLVGLVGIGMLGTQRAEGDNVPTQETPAAVVEPTEQIAPAVEPMPEPAAEPEFKPMPMKRNTRDGNTIKVEGANSGAVINGDGNQVVIDNSVTNNHYNNEPTERVVYRTRTVVKSTPHEVSADCEDLMADHLERKAGYYRMIAAQKRGR